jgi:hypothetical protein
LDQADNLQEENFSRKPSHSTEYEILVEGQLDTSWSEWFDGLKITPQENGETLIAGFIRDQSILQGILTKLFNLRLPLVSVRRIQPGS